MELYATYERKGLKSSEEAREALKDMYAELDAQVKEDGGSTEGFKYEPILHATGESSADLTLKVWKPAVQ